MRRSTSLLLSSGMALALLPLPVPSSPARADVQTPSHYSQRISLWLDRVPISAAMYSLFGAVHAKVVIDPAFTGSLSVNVSGASFEDALRAFIDASDQPTSCSLEGGVYFVEPQAATTGTAVPRIAMIDLPPDVKVVDVSHQNRIAPATLPFVYTTPDGCFQAASSRAINPFTNLPPMPGMTRLNLLMDGTVVIRILAPNKRLSVSNGDPWALSKNMKCDVLNLSPVRSTLFDWGDETVTVSKDVVTLRDKAGRSVTIYPYSKGFK